ncbi:bifunctional DNA-formamidopyrimidine glycosylase/DNA-(apurinic or apyrimidinic site) lyase [Rubinisphaera sp. JC750]|uniref:bifunctional DNA-formamidopyrimidine glycosylase/DNA-(apurinic or apyrimidinic site) lyase n=1 Tax=Rubinisphaera sp. JC750 TaxID=2898658 RepID=UPI0021BCAE6E|nr:bifunctional DNA-formamidopyrimidine glycosylase/DNA-(apurinic or apyrimidinic site) lyase [Rubinisphaera sp. JC750]
MPELPEVETMVRGIRQAVAGTRLAAVDLCPCPRKPITLTPGIDELRDRTVGQTITAVERRAKRVVLRLESEDCYVIEPRMTGLMLLADPPTIDHLRIHWQLRDGRKRRSLWFWDRRGLGTVRLYSPTEYEAALGLQKLGPDALDMTPALWKDALRRTARPIKVALLDQKLVAGIGNLYASEILHAIRLSPETPANTLTAGQIRKLHRSCLAILELAIQYEGSTLGDGTYRNALNKDGSYQNQHRVYGKAGETCPRCQKQSIERIVQAQRSTFYCPRCQK